MFFGRDVGLVAPPLGGLIVHAMEQHVGQERVGMLLSRVTFDILGRLANDVCEVRVETIRPGRTIELETTF